MSGVHATVLRMNQESAPILPPDVEAEQHVLDVADRLLAVQPGECLACYLRRMVHEHGCAEHRFVIAYRDRAAPRATALRARLERLGGFCDCEVLLNAYVTVAELRAEASLEARLRGAIELDDDDAYDAARDELDALDREAMRLEPQPCVGVRGGSTQPCAQWRTVRVDRRMRYGW